MKSLHWAIALLVFATLFPPSSAAEPAEQARRAEVAFSPEGGAEALVLRVLGASRKSIRLAAYSFTSSTVLRALLEARRRGVDVAVVVDLESNVLEDRSGKARAALNLLVNAGVATRTVGTYAVHHDKFIVVDGVHLQTGSFNYSRAAARENSENVLVLWNEPGIAAAYLAHWETRWRQGDPYRSSF